MSSFNTPSSSSEQSSEQSPEHDPHPTADARGLEAAIRALRGDGLVAFPTETVWGLAANARSNAALQALRAWKGRDADQPISLLLADSAAVVAAGLEPSVVVRRLMDVFWPGPLTLVLPTTVAFAAGIARDDGAVGIRCSSHVLAAELARAAELAGVGPLTATSLNRTGEPPPTSQAAARALCGQGQDLPFVFGTAGDDAGGEPATTVLDCTTDPPRILRCGALGAEMLRERAGVDVEVIRVPEDTGPSKGDTSE